MSGFKAKMYQIRFPLGLRPDSAVELTALPRPLAVLNGPTSKVREGKGRGGERKGRKGKGVGRGDETKGGIWSGAPYISTI